MDLGSDEDVDSDDVLDSDDGSVVLDELLIPTESRVIQSFDGKPPPLPPDFLLLPVRAALPQKSIVTKFIARVLLRIVTVKVTLTYGKSMIKFGVG